MTTTLVRDVRTLIHDADRPLTPVERVQLLATLAKPTTGPRDTLDDLRDAIAYARATLAPRLAGEEGVALRRLMRAAAAVLDHDTTPTGSTTVLSAGLRGAAANAHAGTHWTERDTLTPTR